MEKNYVSEMLIRIGINPSYRGYPFLVHIIHHAATDANGPFLTSKALYQNAAEHYHVSPDAIQHSIRTILDTYWDRIMANTSVMLPDTLRPDRCRQKNLLLSFLII